MKNSLARYCPQPALSTAVVTLAVATAVACWWSSPLVAGLGRAGLPTMMLALGLLTLIVLAYKFRVHVGPSMKVSMMSVPLYLAAVVLPPPVALVLAGLGVLIGELLTRVETDNLPSDIATAAGRWVVLGCLTSVVAHLPLRLAPFDVLPLLLAALVMFAGDALTVALSVGPIVHERPSRIVVTMLREGGVAEGVQYLLGLLGALVVLREPWALALLVFPTVLVYLAFKRAKEMQTTTRALLEGMADAVDLRDPYTGGHSRRVTEYTAGILQAMERKGTEVELIVAAARVHDIGKIGVPDSVLKKPGPLTREERALMEQHADRGADLLRRYPDFARGVSIVRHHHEAWDGSGYPHRLKGTDIPFGARVIAVADAFDAMISDRPYRRGMSPQRAAQILREGRNRQWDAAIVDAFLLSVAERVERTAAVHLQVIASVDDAVRVHA